MRKTTRGYAALNTSASYIVDRRKQEAIYDGSGYLLALTNQFYDGNNSVANTVGTKGELTRIAKYYDTPPQAISEEWISDISLDM